VIVAMVLDLSAPHFGSAYYDVLQSLIVNVHGQTFTAIFQAQDNQVNAGFADATNGDIWNYIYVPATVDPTRLAGAVFEFRDPTQTASIGINPLPFDQWTGGADAIDFILWDPSATIDLQNGYRIFGDLSSFSPPSSVPEPTTLLLFGTGLGVLLKKRRFDLN
jgi:hypothetical protein